MSANGKNKHVGEGREEGRTRASKEKENLIKKKETHANTIIIPCC